MLSKAQNLQNFTYKYVAQIRGKVFPYKMCKMKKVTDRTHNDTTV